ncbi:MAG: hypothetical protein I3265_01800 [Candidatus Moeniiplasma glomeromycotorum]|nr:hypothetical protein [Candidatus Moeniiplasma glomeromycotorum]MCE8162501.1 hypothetical protein [Candidatus Moeniiplasma glomeromycotorum]
MSLISKLYSYYFSNLFRKNWIRLILFTFLASVGAWFIAPYASFKLFGKTGLKKFMKDNFRGQTELFLNDDTTKFEIEGLLEEEWAARQAWETARQGGNEVEIERAEAELLDRSKPLLGSSTIFSPTPPIQELSYNELSLGVETENPEHKVLKLINKLSFWAVTGGISFSYLTLHLVDFLFLTPKKNGEEATVLNFTPGVKRSDLLISKILVFLTYYSLFGLVTFILPGFFYYLWVGSAAPLNLAWLFLYTFLAAPLLAFGLVILPYLLLSSWSSLLGSLFSYALLSLPLGFFLLALKFPWAYKIRDLFFNPLIFVPLALGAGVVCLAIYYYQCQSEDLKD